jgi:hypothetical protein
MARCVDSPLYPAQENGMYPAVAMKIGPVFNFKEAKKMDGDSLTTEHKTTT